MFGETPRSTGLYGRTPRLAQVPGAGDGIQEMHRQDDGGLPPAGGGREEMMTVKTDRWMNRWLDIFDI